MSILKCECQDSAGMPCGKAMTKEEYDQDGMCTKCANHIWRELRSEGGYTWTHHNGPSYHCKD